jgi:hypothetical protein
LGENPFHNLKLQSVLAEIKSKIGWKSIEENTENLYDLYRKNYSRQLAGV